MFVDRPTMPSSPAKSSARCEEEELPGGLAELGADHLLVLLVENNKGEDFKAGGTINIHVYSPKQSFEGYSDLYMNEDGVRVAFLWNGSLFEGSMGYFN